MTPQEAIYRIKTHITVHRVKEPFAIRIIQALYVAIEAIEKQIPKKPKDHPLSDGKCPYCNAVFDYDWKPKSKFCQNCGQALDWSDSE